MMFTKLRTVMCFRVWRRNVCNSLIYLLILFSLCYCSALDNLKCQLSKSCWCAYPEGYGVNLSKVSKWYTSERDNWTYYFNPCLPSSSSTAEPTKCPTGASVCAHYINGSYIDLGFENETESHSDAMSTPIQLTFRHMGRLTNVQLDCAMELNEPSFVVAPLLQPNQYDMVLASPALCLGKLVTEAPDTPTVAETTLSTGSVLVIMFFVFTSLYFVGGALALKLLRGAEGKEVIPNYDFWVGLPQLVKEGFLFTVNGCQTPQAYDRI